jgi:hypothetical protein
MKSFVAGATGALGRRRVRATPVVLDALDRDAVIDVLAAAISAKPPRRVPGFRVGLGSSEAARAA